MIFIGNFDPFNLHRTQGSVEIEMNLISIFFSCWVWRDFRVKMEVDVPVSVAYNFYLDRESFPKWMPFISSVEVDLISPTN